METGSRHGQSCWGLQQSAAVERVNLFLSRRPVCLGLASAHRWKHDFILGMLNNRVEVKVLT